VPDGIAQACYNRPVSISPNGDRTMSDVQQRIDDLVKGHKVVLFSRALQVVEGIVSFMRVLRLRPVIKFSVKYDL
jgi:hypothetical protein